jgi:hypothetical protein
MPGITAVPDVVDAPTIGSATAGVESATVTYTAAATGGAATSFTAISTPGSITGSSATSPITVSGLTGGTAYTFKVYGANSSGTWSVNQSSASNSVTPTVATAFQSISTITVGSGGAANVEFTSIPGTYTHLQIRISSLGSANVNQGFNTTYNGDTGTNYSSHWLYGNGSSLGSGATANDSIQYFGFSLYSSYPNASIIDIFDYANTNKYKTMRCLTGSDRNGAGVLYLFSGAWRNTNAITSIKITPNSGNINQYSKFALYGIKSA